MANIGKLNNLSIDDLASLWNIDKADIAKVMGLNVGVAGNLSTGSPEIFKNGGVDYISVTTMDNTHAIVTYRDNDDSGKGKAVCLKLSGTSITAGFPTTFGSGWALHASVTTMNSTHAIVVYRDKDDNDIGKAVCLELSGMGVIAGSPITFESGSTMQADDISVTTMNSTHAIVTYKDYYGSNKGKAVCLTLSGTSITAHTPTTFESRHVYHTSVTSMDSTNAIVTYRDNDDDNKGKAVCLKLSGTSITAGSPTTFESGYADRTSVTSINNTYAIVTYSDFSDNQKGKAVCLTLSGTSIIAETPIIFESESTSDISVTAIDINHAIVTYRDGIEGKAVCLTLSGTTITVGSPITFESNSAAHTSVTTMNTTHAIVTYEKYSGIDEGKAVCITLS